VTLIAKTASGLYYAFESDLLKKYSTDLSLFSADDRPTDVDDCYEIGLRSLKGTNFCHFRTFSARSGRSIYCTVVDLS